MQPVVQFILDRAALSRDSRDPFPFRVRVVTKAGHVEWPTLHGDTPAWAEPNRVPKALRDEAAVLLIAARDARRQVEEYRDSTERPVG